MTELDYNGIDKKSSEIADEMLAKALATGNIVKILHEKYKEEAKDQILAKIADEEWDKEIEEAKKRSQEALETDRKERFWGRE